MCQCFEMKDKIYPVSQKMIKLEAQKFCIKYKELYISNFFNLPNDIALQTESKGKYDIYCQIKKQYHICICICVYICMCGYVCVYMHVYVGICTYVPWVCLEMCI